ASNGGCGCEAPTDQWQRPSVTVSLSGCEDASVRRVVCTVRNGPAGLLVQSGQARTEAGEQARPLRPGDALPLIGEAEEPVHRPDAQPPDRLGLPLPGEMIIPRQRGQRSRNAG